MGFRFEGEGYEPLEHLRDMYLEWTDKIPDYLIHSDSRIFTKARKGYFVGIIADVANILDEGLLSDPEGVQAAKELLETFDYERLRGIAMISSDDIELANELVKKILDVSFGEL